MRFCLSWDDATALMHELVDDGEVCAAPLQKGSCHVANWKIKENFGRISRRKTVETKAVLDKDVVDIA